MSEELDKVLNKLDVKDRVYSLARSWGATEELATVFADSKKEQFKFDGVNLTWNVTGNVAVDDADCRAHFTQGSLKALFPTTAATLPEVDADLLDSARAGNQTARTRIFKQLGSLRDTDALIAQKPADDSTKDDSKNPWRSANFKTDKAAQAAAAGIIKRLGTGVAANLARSAGKTIIGDPLRA